MGRATVGRRVRRVHRISAAAMVVGLVTGLVAADVARNVAADNERHLLTEEASITANSFTALANQVKGVVDSAASVAAVTDVNHAAFQRLVGAQGSYFSSWVVLRDTRAGWTTAFSSGTPKPPPVAVLAAMAPDQLHIFGFIGTGAGRVLGVGERISQPPGYVVYGEVPLPESAVRADSQAPGQTTSLRYALYLDGSERTNQAVLASAAVLPITGRRATVAIDPQADTAGAPRLGTRLGTAPLKPGELLLVVAAEGRLGGELAGLLPWILLGVALVIGMGMAVLFETILRRRDDALHVVHTLEAQNEALDRALAEQARSEEERAMLETRLRAAHRLEAVGKLAGGVAHDFNNLLAVILNYATFASESLEGHPARADVEEVVTAARRASRLTHKLLVFSRQDIVESTVVDVNHVVSGMQPMLERTIGEDLNLETALDPDAPPVLADESELEQVVMNLAVNARDAMQSGAGGRLVIRTGTVELAGDELRRHPGLSAGTYTELTVEDTGQGMTDEVLARAFEPFFTTKGPGEGTGLGLATVYGIATRWGGEVTAWSAPGSGTTVTVLLPAVAAGVEAAAVPAPAASRPTEKGKTVLLVEDEDAVRRAARRILERAGYGVTEAATGAEILARGDLDRPDLLISDVVMPGGVSGRELADTLEARWPGLAVLFMSGYTADVIGRRGVIEPGVQLVEKPFTATALVEAAAAALEAASVGAGR